MSCVRELAGAVDADEQLELAFSGLHLSEIDVEETLAALALVFVALGVWQAGDAVPQKTSVER